jgi:hypothetical protein
MSVVDYRAVILTVPERAELLEDLQHRLAAPLPVPVYLDSDRSTRTNVLSWPAAACKAADAARAAEVTHLMVIEDDVLPCGDFLAAATLAIRHRPQDVVSFYASRGETLKARDKGSSWAPCRRWLNAQAMAWPLPIWERCWAWMCSKMGQRYLVEAKSPGADDWFQQFLEAERIRVLATAPSLVDHRPVRSATPGHQGGVRWRARWFIGEDGSGLQVDWRN